MWLIGPLTSEELLRRRHSGLLVARRPCRSAVPYFRRRAMFSLTSVIPLLSIALVGLGFAGSWAEHRGLALIGPCSPGAPPRRGTFRRSAP